MAEKKSKLVTAAAAATPRNVITAPSVIMTSGTKSPSSGQDSASQLFRSNFASSPGGATPTSASTSTSTSTSTTAAAAFFSRTSSISPTSPTSTIQYDHETYLELLAGKSRSVEKTASQVYREERARKLSLRARDPAVLSGPIDLVDMGVFATQDHIGEYLYNDRSRR